MEDIVEFVSEPLGVLVASLVICALIIIPLAAINIYFEKGQCKQLTAMHSDDFEFQWVFYGGCMAKTSDGRWVDADEYIQLELVP